MKSRAGLVEPVAELRRHLGERKLLQRSFTMDGLSISSATVPDGAEIEVDLTLESIFDGVVLSGHIAVPWTGECRRCLEDVEGKVSVDVREIFEVKPTEGETWPLKGDEIDLEPIVRDAALLALPLAPLCSPDCLGPAPDQYPAAADGNGQIPEDEGLTTDEKTLADPRWAALDELDL